MAGGERVLVTGGAGYLGCVLVPELLGRGHAVRVYDSLLFGDAGLSGVKGHPAFELVRADVRARASLEAALAGVDAVIDLAAFSNDPSGDLDPATTVAVNRDATERLVELASRSSARRLVFASTSSVYGTKDADLVTEDLPLEPLTVYARTKAEAERAVLAANRDGFTTVCARPGTICGRSPRQRFDLVVNLLTGQALHARRMTVFGGGQTRPSLHLRDAAALFALLLEAPPARVGGEVFNAARENLSVLAIAGRIRDALGGEIPIEATGTDDFRSYRLSSAKIERVLGFRPRHGIEEAVAELRAAHERGEIGDPSAARYHNVRWLREQAGSR